MNLFFGIHEVRLFRPSGVVVGYFDNWEDALRAVENEPSLYKATYFTLNPIKLPSTIPLNPQVLTPSRNAAGASDIERRTWLLADLDPPRSAHLNSTDDEKEQGRRQADAVREYLRSGNWPEPTVCDSGNGWHLLYRIDLPNDAAATELVRAVLASLHELFSMVDRANFDAPRLCKFYGSWARKGEHSEERPWRQSAVLEEGERKPVTIAQLRAICDSMPAASIQQGGDGIARPGAQEKFVRRFTAFCERIGVNIEAVRQLGDGTLLVQTEFCLLNEDHKGSSCGVGVGRDGVRKNLCKHNGCAMPWAKWSRLVEHKHGESMRLDGGIRWK
jgi:hypothetical protein